MVGFNDRLSIFAATPKLSAAFLLVPSVSPLLLLVGFIRQRINASVFSNSPLRKTVEGIVRTGIRKPLFATVAETVSEYLDPDDYEYRRIKNVYVAATRSGFKPVYERVDEFLDSARATEALLTSAALPLGIVPNSRTGEKRIRCVDGGVSDNTPWFPLIDSLPCEQIVIVLCEPESAAKDEAKLTRDMWSRRDRAIRIMTDRHTIPNYQMRTPWDRPPLLAAKNNPPKVVPLQDPEFWPESRAINVVVISPSDSLGNLLSGTMNFSRARAQENIERGREAAQLALKRLR
jgi:predicted acylesterase/phospholipase RssA